MLWTCINAPKLKEVKNIVWRQLIAVVSVNLLAFSDGCHVVWISPTVPLLTSNNTLVNPLGDKPATVSDISLIAGSSYVGAIVGCFVPAKVLDTYGLKKVIAFVAALMLAASITLIFAASVWLYCVCRLILGMGKTATFILIPMYVGEIAHKDNRGRYSFYLPMFLAMGLVYSYIVGPYFSTQVYTILCTLPILLSLSLILLVVPETPYFLMAKNRPRHEIAAVLGKLRNSSDLEEEMKQIEEVVTSKSASGGQKTSNFMTLFRDRASRKAFIICIAEGSFLMLSGVAVVQSFLGPIMDKVTAAYISGNTSAIAISSVKLVFTWIGSLVVERFGRKPLLVWSAVLVAISHLSLGELGYEFVSILSPLPLVCFVLFSVAYSFGLGSVPFTYLSEFFPQHTKNLGVPICNAIGAVVNALIILVFPYFMEYFGMHVLSRLRHFYKICGTRNERKDARRDSAHSGRMSWTSPTIPRLLSNDTMINPLGDNPATVSDISYIAGSYFLGCLAGNLIPAGVLDRYGRKQVMALTAALMSFASIVLAFSAKVWLYCLCRLVLGIGGGATFMLIPLYTGEVAHKGNRGRLNYYLTMSLGLGFIYSYSTGSRFSTKVYTLLCSLPTLLALLFILLMIPETPYFLVSKKKTRSEIIKALSKLRSCDDLEDEMKQIECSLLSGTTVIYGFLSPILDTVTATYWSGNTSAIAISMVNLICTITGSLTVERCGYSLGLGSLPFAYASELFPHHTKNVAVPVCTAIGTICNAVFTVIFPFFMQYLGIQWCFWLFAASCTGCAIFTRCVLFRAFWVQLWTKLQQPTLAEILHFSSETFWQETAFGMVCYVGCSLSFIAWGVFPATVAYSLGLGSVPFTYLSEFFPQHTKNLGVPICNAIAAVVNALIILVFPYFMEYLGMQWIFWLFAVSCFGYQLAMESLAPLTEASRNVAYHDEEENRHHQHVLDERKTSTKEKGTGLLFVTVVAVNLLAFSDGCHLAWTSPTVPRLKSNDTLINPLGDHPATATDISLIAGSYFVGSVIGCLIPAKVLDSYGRKPVMALVAALMSVASIVLAFASSVWLYCLCRLILDVPST
nr:unnamed protein product [Callosobruchus analis]